MHLVLSQDEAASLQLPGARGFFLALIRRVDASRTDDGLVLYDGEGVHDVIDLTTMHCVVGRVRDRKKWSIIDRSDAAPADATFSAPHEDLV